MEKYTLHHLTHHIHLRRFLHDRYNDLVIADTFRGIALSMVSLFIPLFLIHEGYSLLAIVLFRLSIEPTNTLFFTYITYRLPAWGVKRTLIISYIFNTGLYLALYNITELRKFLGWFGFLFVIVLIYSIADSAYWSAHHAYFISTTRAKDSGSKAGLLMAVPVFLGIIGPFLGGLIITKYGWQLAFLISTLLLILASGALLFSKEIKIKTAHIKLKHIIDRKQMTKNITYMLQGAGFVSTSFVWPLLLFFNSIKLVSIGLLYLLSNLAHSIICYVAGKQSDKHGNRNLVRGGALGHSITLIMRVFTTTLAGISFWQTLGGLFGAFHFVTLESGFYRASHHDRANRTINRELYLNIGRAIFIVCFIALVLILPEILSLKAAMIIGSLAIAGLSLVAKRKSPIIN